MKIVSFEDVEAKGYEICFVHSGCDGKADVIILDIVTIFDYEEKKGELCKEDYYSIAIIDDLEDYDVFKNFGISTWIKREEISKLPSLLDEIKTKLGL
jgi:hypothetical protein